MISWLLLGLGMGVRHALEADHIAAVASLSARARGRSELLRVAGAWGLGHALTLIALAVLWVATGLAVPDAALPFAEAAAGALLVWLGIDLLRRRELAGLHFRSHEHSDGTRHWHAERVAVPDVAEHTHPPHPLRRALCVGAVHGLAGSALLGLFATSGVVPGRVVSYAVVFGVGATVGMLLLSAVVSVPLGLERVRAIALGRACQAALGLASIAVGVWVGAGALLAS